MSTKSTEYKNRLRDIIGNENKTAKKSVEAQPKPSSKFLRTIGIIISAILSLSTLATLGTLLALNILPLHYFMLLTVIMIVVTTGFVFLNCRTKTKTAIRIPIFILSIVFALLNFFATSYLSQTSNFFDQLKPQNTLTEHYYVVVQNDSEFQDIKDLEHKSIQTFDEKTDIYASALEQLNSAVSANLSTVDAVSDLASHLLKGQTDAIFLSATYKAMLEEDDETFSNNARILYTIEVSVDVAPETQTNIDVSAEPFTVLISGSDAYGDISDRSRSDVNMLVTVNPRTHTILLTSIPRDYYVQLHGTTGPRDKLTHAGIYGIQMSANTISNLLNVKVDYYVKVNFSTVVNLVDTIGGIDVYSDQKFVPWTNRAITIPEGNVHMDGATALAFARERKSYATGDRHRVQNQQAVLKAIIDKVSHSTVLLTKYSEILNDLSSSLETNLGKDEISSLIRLQLQDMPNWQVYEYNLNGSDAREVTYSMGNQPLYVMMPDQATVEAAHNYITAVLNGEPVNL